MQTGTRIAFWPSKRIEHLETDPPLICSLQALGTHQISSSEILFFKFCVFNVNFEPLTKFTKTTLSVSWFNICILFYYVNIEKLLPFEQISIIFLLTGNFLFKEKTRTLFHPMHFLTHWKLFVLLSKFTRQFLFYPQPCCSQTIN